MATRTWSSAGSTDGNDTANWSGSGALAGEDLVFNATSVVNCTFTAALGAKSVTTEAGYTGNWVCAYLATLTDGFSFDHTGALNYSGGLDFSGATGHIGAAVGTLTSGTVTVRNANAVLDYDKTGNSHQHGTIIVNNSAGCTYGGSTGYPEQKAIIIGDSSRFTNNFATALTLRNTDSATVLSMGTGATCNGSGVWLIRPGASGKTYTIANFVYTGSATWFDINESGSNIQTVTFTGVTNFGSSMILRVGGGSNATGSVYNFGTSLTCKNLYAYSYYYESVAKDTYNYGSCAVTCENWVCGSRTTQNMETATFNITAGIVAPSYGTINSGTSTTNFATGPVAVVGNGKHLYNVNIGAGCTVTGLETITIDGAFVDNSSDIDWTDKQILISGNASFSGTYIWNGATVVIGGTSIVFSAGMTLNWDADTRLILMNSGAILTTNGVTMPTNLITANISFPAVEYVHDPASGGPATYGSQELPLTGTFNLASDRTTYENARNTDPATVDVDNIEVGTTIKLRNVDKAGTLDLDAEKAAYEASRNDDPASIDTNEILTGTEIKLRNTVVVGTNDTLADPSFIMRGLMQQQIGC